MISSINGSYYTGDNDHINQVNKEEVEEFQQDIELSILSYSSYDSLEHIKLEKMSQYTCDECSEIPKIISTNFENKSILIKCKNHGQKEIKLRDYLINCLKFNPNNWKCAVSDHYQQLSKEEFIYCQCGFVFCQQCFGVHKLKTNHNKLIESSKYFLRCKNPEHFGDKYSGYCLDCNDNFCEKCEQNHKNHSTINNNDMEVEEEDIESIRKLNKEYRALITYYESLIRLNNLIIYSYEINRGNYYNLYNINRLISDIKRKNYISTLRDNIDNSKYDDKNTMAIDEKNINFSNYVMDLYKQDLKEDETIEININNKYFNNFDLKILTKIPLYNLKVLGLDNNCITKINYLENAEFPELIILSLRNNAIVDISVLSKVKFEEIQGLILSNNYINDINVFKKIKFKKLRLIDLRNNNIDNIEAFGFYGVEKLTVLQSIYLSGNKFDIKKYRYVKELLEKCDEFIF